MVHVAAKPMRRRSCWRCCSTATPPVCLVPARSKRRPTRRCLSALWRAGCIPITTRWRNFRKTFLNEIKALFVQMLLLAQTAGYFKLGNISMDGSKVHANASKSQAVSYQRLLALEVHLRAEVDQLFSLAEQADRHELPEGLNVADEIALRQERLARLAEAKQVLRSPGPGTPGRRAGRVRSQAARAGGESQALAGASQAGGRRRRRLASRKTRTSTTSPILSRAS